MARITLLTEALELGEILTAAWPPMLEELRRSGVPLNDGGDADAGAGGGDSDGADGAAASGDDDTSDDDTGAAGADDDIDWKAQSRKHEREAKKARKEAAAAEARAAELESANQSDHERALADAKKTAREEALGEVAQERRADRLESAVTKLATKDFQDVDDVLTYVERAIAKGDIDEGDLFDDKHRVQEKALKSVLKDLGEAKPHWKSGPNGQQQEDDVDHGDADAGRGSGSGASRSMNDLIRGKGR